MWFGERIDKQINEIEQDVETHSRKYKQTKGIEDRVKELTFTGLSHFCI